MNASLAGPRRLAFLARTPVPQKLPRINPQLVVIVEMKLDRILAHAFRRNRFDRGLVHGQRPRRKFRRLSGLVVRFGPRLVAQRARTRIPQEGKRIMRHPQCREDLSMLLAPDVMHRNLRMPPVRCA